MIQLLPPIRRLALAGLLGLLPASTAMGAQELLPDLVPEPLTTFAFDTTTQPGRVLMRLDTSITNTGAGDAILAGSLAPDGTMSAFQRITNDDGTAADLAPAWTFVFASADGHGHWHVLDMAGHTLDRLDRSGGVVGSIPLTKVGFCLTDSRSPVTPRPIRYGGCGEPTTQQVLMGIQPGFSDLYAAELPSQWIDITGQPPGSYQVRAVVDPGNKLRESSKLNNTTATRVRLPAITQKLTRERSGFQDTIRRGRRAAAQIAAITVSHRSILRAQVFRKIGRNAIVVADLRPRRVRAGANRVFWNGRDRRGRIVPRGRYQVKLIASVGRVKSDPLYVTFRVR